MVTVTDVQELMEGHGLEPGEEDNPTVLNIVLERFMQERGLETYDDLYSMVIEAGYDALDLEGFLDQCDGTVGDIHQDFVRGIADVLDLGSEEKMAFAWANLWGRKPVS
jgi:hypothetical protein